MSKADATATPAAPATPGRERVADVRIQSGGCHWSGARLVTHLTTDGAKVGVSGANVVVAEEMTLHPAGVLVVEANARTIVPYARVETIRLA
jgi:hypothetical protein